jgi:hypothetical protein
MAGRPSDKTPQGFTKGSHLSDDQIDQIIDGVREGKPVHVAAREAGTSASQFRQRVNREEHLRVRVEEALTEGREAYNDLLRDVAWHHVFVERDYKAARDQMLIHLPEWEMMRTQRFEIGNADGEALRIAAQQAFGDLTRDEIEQRLRMLEGERVQGEVLQLVQAPDGE